MTSKVLRIGARGSPLSLAQTSQVKAALEAANPGQSFAILPIVTSGDRIQDRSLVEAGGKGLFTKEIDEALLDGRVDMAVHSMKDLPSQLPDGISLACTPRREDPRDALICTKADALAALPHGAIVGTASLRRQAQLLSLRPDFTIVMLRGNVDTRLRKVQTGEVDATLLAYAGLRRLGLETHAASLIDPILFPPAPCQGALAITVRTGDAVASTALGPLEDEATGLETAAERAFLTALDGSCKTPIAALARWSGGRLSFMGELLAPDGSFKFRRVVEAGCTSRIEAADLGDRLGDSIKAEAADVRQVIA